MKVHCIDLNFFQPKVIASYLIESPDGLILVDTGPSTVYENLVAGIKDLGHEPEDVKHILLTHIHLDHSGGAWQFANKGARVYVHERGAKHLIDPAKLVASAEMIFKDKMEELWGQIEPVNEIYVQIARDREIIDIGGLEITVLETPGHASHHNAYLVDNAVFAGDVAGVRIDGGPILVPTPPPDINLEAWQDSIAKIRSAGPDVLYLAHFGDCKDVNEHLDRLEDDLLEFTDWIGNRLKDGKTEDDIVPEYERYIVEHLSQGGADEINIKSYEYADFFWMNVWGMARYWKKFRFSS